MTTQTLHIEFEPSEGALLRLIGLIERRGYSVRGLALPETAGSSMHLDMALTPHETGRDIGVLSRQIRRLVGVRQVAAVQPQSANEGACHAQA